NPRKPYMHNGSDCRPRLAAVACQCRRLLRTTGRAISTTAPITISGTKIIAAMIATRIKREEVSLLIVSLVKRRRWCLIAGSCSALYSADFRHACEVPAVDAPNGDDAFTINSGRTPHR